MGKKSKPKKSSEQKRLEKEAKAAAAAEREQAIQAEEETAFARSRNLLGFASLLSGGRTGFTLGGG